MALESNQGKYCALSRREVCTKTHGNIPSSEHRRKRAGRCASLPRQINMTSRDNLAAFEKFNARARTLGTMYSVTPNYYLFSIVRPSTLLTNSITFWLHGDASLYDGKLKYSRAVSPQTGTGYELFRYPGTDRITSRGRLRSEIGHES